MSERDLRHRSSRLRARLQDLLLQLRCMSPATHALGVFHGVHLNLN